METNRAIKAFLHEHFFSGLFSEECPGFVNIKTSYKTYLKEVLDLNQNEIDVLFQSSKKLLVHRINEKINEYKALGLAPPLYEVGDYEYLTWVHDRFEEYSGIKKVDKSFFKIVDWVDSLDSNQFLIACSLVLKVMGCDKIYITDGAYDQGIDLIGKVSTGEYNSFVFFVQAKTKDNSLIKKEIVLAEFGKFAALFHTEKYQEYRAALGLNNLMDGCSYCYLFLTNSEFHDSSKSISALAGILLRSRRQISKIIHDNYDFDDLVTLKARINKKIPASLNTNVISLLPDLVVT